MNNLTTIPWLVMIVLSGIGIAITIISIQGLSAGKIMPIHGTSKQIFSLLKQKMEKLKKL